MLFPTLTFGVFFLIVLSFTWALDRENGRRKLLLLIASYVFYASWNWKFLALIWFSTIRTARGSHEPWHRDRSAAWRNSSFRF